jgi:hypothetical protein
MSSVSSLTETDVALVAQWCYLVIFAAMVLENVIKLP